MLVLFLSLHAVLVLVLVLMLELVPVLVQVLVIVLVLVQGLGLVFFQPLATLWQKSELIKIVKGVRPCRAYLCTVCVFNSSHFIRPE